MRLQGYPVSSGIAFGTVRIVLVKDLPIPRRSLSDDPVVLDAEVARFEAALDASTQEIEALRDQARAHFTDDFLAVFDAHVVLLQDPSLTRDSISKIRKERLNAEYAIHLVVEKMVKALLSTGDTYFQERTIDLEDIHRRIQRNLSGASQPTSSLDEKNQIILADTLGPSDATSLHQGSLLGFATEHGGQTSHTAILARSLEIPAVVGVQGLMETATKGAKVIIDGIEGVVILEPTEKEIEEYKKKQEAWVARRKAILSAAREIPRTIDGHRVLLTANVDLTTEIETSVKYGAEGVGLYRSEFLFIEHSPRIPTEEEHTRCYSELSKAFYPHRVVIRTYDLGGEKYFHKVFERHEPNPVMGLRAIRFCLRRPDIFKPQLRGILRASGQKNLAILLPLITTLEEVLRTKELIEEAKGELRSQGISFDENIPVGIMVEVPSCALCAEAFVPHVDFFSIGTNDLIQYIMAIDRNNDSVASLYDPMHPSILRCIKHVCDSAGKAHKPVAICGEAGADPRMIPLLLGLGVDEFSMTPTLLLDAREVIQNLTHRKCIRLARHALKARTGMEVANMVKDFMEGKRR
jgi:phosphotransferase system enzyme I (PtsI)